MMDGFYDFLDKIGYLHPIHPAMVHMPIGLIVGSLFIGATGLVFSRASMARAASAAAWGPGMVSLAMTRRRASGNTRAAYSVIRSTPGPIGAIVPSAVQTGQAFGIGSVWPQWWQVSWRRARCSTSQAVQFGQASRWPQARQRVSGA